MESGLPVPSVTSNDAVASRGLIVPPPLEQMLRRAPGFIQADEVFGAWIRPRYFPRK